MKQTKFEYLTSDGYGLTIEITPIEGAVEGKGPQFKAKAEVHNAKELSEGETTPLIDMTMATGMRQLMEMVSWPEMFIVETTNFQVAMGNGEEGMMPGMVMGGPMTEA